MATHYEQGKIINTSMEPHQPTQQLLLGIFAQAKGPRLGERVSFAQASPSCLGESSTGVVVGFQRVLAQATTPRLSETTSRSKHNLSLRR